MFLKRNPGEAHYSVEQLQQMAESGSARSLINEISRYSANITGTHSYWHKLRDDLKAIILHAGLPTFFFTFSAVDMHWPELHSLCHDPIETATFLTDLFLTILAQ